VLPTLFEVVCYPRNPVPPATLHCGPQPLPHHTPITPYPSSILWAAHVPYQQPADNGGREIALASLPHVASLLGDMPEMFRLTTPVTP